MQNAKMGRARAVEESPIPASDDRAVALNARIRRAPPSKGTLLSEPASPSLTVNSSASAGAVGLRLSADWISLLAFRARSGSQELHEILRGYGQPSQDLLPHPNVFVFPGITYLMPIAQAVEVFSTSYMCREAPRRQEVCDALPAGLFFRRYDIQAGNYQELTIVFDRADQVVALSFRSKTKSPPFAPPEIPEFKLVLDNGYVSDFIDYNRRPGSQTWVADARELGGYVVAYTVSGNQTITWYLPQPVISLLLFATAPESIRKGGR